MTSEMGAPSFDVVVIGGSQAGLAVGYHLTQRGCRLRDPGCRLRDRARVAFPMGLAHVVHPCAVQRASRDGLSVAERQVPVEGRRRRVSPVLRIRLRSSRQAQRQGHVAHPARRDVRRGDRGRGVYGEPGRRRGRAVPGSLRPSGRRRGGRGGLPDPQRRLSEPGSTA